MSYNPFPQPPAASVADFALAFARGAAAAQAANNRAILVSGANVNPVAPANLAAPATAIVASILLTPKVSGLLSFYFNLVYVLSAAGAVTAAVSGYENPTGGLVGGTTTNGVQWESSAISAPTGGATSFVPATYDQTDPAGGLTQTCNLVGVLSAIVNVPVAILFAVSAAGNLSGMVLTAGAYELV